MQIKLTGNNIAMSYDCGLFKYAEVKAEAHSPEAYEKIQNLIKNEKHFNLCAYAEIEEYAVCHMKDCWEDDNEEYAYGNWEIADRPFEML
jgi:hypothetical protein